MSHRSAVVAGSADYKPGAVAGFARAGLRVEHPLRMTEVAPLISVDLRVSTRLAVSSRGRGGGLSS